MSKKSTTIKPDAIVPVPTKGSKIEASTLTTTTPTKPKSPTLASLKSEIDDLRQEI